MAKLWTVIDDSTLALDMEKCLRCLGFETQAVPRALLSDQSPSGADAIVLSGAVPPLPAHFPPVLLTPESPFDPACLEVLPLLSEKDRFKRAVERGLEHGKLLRENQSLREALRAEQGVGELVGESQTMTSLFALIGRLSHAAAPVLITGERGTGKEVVAREIHRRGPRHQQPFVPLRCSATPEDLFESELFGHVAGSFPGALRDKPGLLSQCRGGTLFLDDVGHLPLRLQGKLLRLIQEKTYQARGASQWQDSDVRILAAHTGDLKDRIRQGTFREDLFYRLNVIPIHLPPLRERPEDITVMADHFVRRYARAHGKKIEGISTAARERLLELPWEGNVRELESVMDRAVVLTEGPWIEIEALEAGELSDPRVFFDQVTSQFPTLDELERQYIELVLQKTGGRKDQAAGILGINRRTLYRKEQEYGWRE